MPSQQKQVNARIKHIYKTTAEWENANSLVLLSGEVGYEQKTDGAIFAKVGDGETPWGSLPYISARCAETAIVISSNAPADEEAIWFKVATDTQLSYSVKITEGVVSSTTPTNPNVIWFKTN